MAFYARTRYGQVHPPPPSDVGLSLVVVLVIVGLLGLFLAAIQAIPSSTVSGPRGGGPLPETTSGVTYSEYIAPERAPTQPPWMLPGR